MKEKLRETVGYTEAQIRSIEFKHTYRRAPAHFSRESKLNFENTAMIVLNAVKKSIKVELMNYFNQTEIEGLSPSRQAFTEAREKIDYNAFRDLFEKTCELSLKDKDAQLFKGYTVIFYVSRYNLSLANIESEKELHIKDGYGARKHQPDFVCNINDKKIAVELELNPKSKMRMEQNLKDNYLNFDIQVWITDNSKVMALLQEFKDYYSNINVMRLESVLEYVNERYR